jgi:Fe-S cluster assembly protein SufD
MSTEAQGTVQPVSWLAATGPVGRQDQPDWIADLRARAADKAASMPLPDRRQEAWRYTPVRFLEEQRFTPAAAEPFAALQLSDIEDLLLPQGKTTRLVFINGYLAAGLCDEVDGQRGVEVRTLGGDLGPLGEVLRGNLDALAEKRHVFAALNAALMSDGALIHVQGDQSADGRPIELLHVSVGMDEPVVSHPRHLIVLDEGTRAQVIERYVTVGNAQYFNNALIEVALGGGSELAHARVQEESGQAQHLSDLHVRLQADARYRLSTVALGGAWSRTDIRVDFAGEGAEAELDGLMLAKDRQLNDVHLDIAHNQPRCTSRETFRGVLDGKGKVVFDGRILVARDAQLTDAALSNDNLMLSRSSEVDTKPQLEIYADDVKCSHGTTVGELDANMLFYLRSRGIPEAKAKQMLCEGFAAEIVDRIEHEPLRDYVARRLAARLAEAG